MHDFSAVLGRLLLTPLVSLGVILAGCGGGGGDGSGDSGGQGDPRPPPNCAPPVCWPTVLITPVQPAAQAGQSIILTAETFNIDPPIRYQWGRFTGLTFVPIDGERNATLVLNSVLPSQSGLLRVNVEGSKRGQTVWETTDLFVSSLPPVVLQDSEFQPADWSVSVMDPAPPAVPHTEERAQSGGNPDAFRKMSQVAPAGLQNLRLLHTYLAGSYDPAVHGAAEFIAYHEDCTVVAANGLRIDSMVTPEQGMRRFIATIGVDGCSTTWQPSSRYLKRITAQNFTFIDGPWCIFREPCPDFSAAGAPMRFGYARSTNNYGATDVSIEHGIDNWRVEVWRK